MNQPVDFNYGGHSFRGVRTFTENEDFRTITREMAHPVTFDSVVWNLDDFYLMAEKDNAEDYDIFLMDGRYEVLPAHNGLFLWGALTAQRYNRAEAVLHSLDALIRDAGVLRRRFLDVVRHLFGTFHLSDCLVSRINNPVYATFCDDYGEMAVFTVVRVYMRGGTLMFETDEGIFGEDNLIGGFEQIASAIRRVLV